MPECIPEPEEIRRSSIRFTAAPQTKSWANSSAQYVNLAERLVFRGGWLCSAPEFLSASALDLRTTCLVIFSMISFRCSICIYICFKFLAPWIYVSLHSRCPLSSLTLSKYSKTFDFPRHVNFFPSATHGFLHRIIIVNLVLTVLPQVSVSRSSMNSSPPNKRQVPLLWCAVTIHAITSSTRICNLRICKSTNL